MGSRSGAVVQMLPRHRFTVDEYERMVETGILGKDDRVELLRGDVVEMAPIGSRHASTVKRLVALFRSLPDEVILSVQDPLRLADSEPEPDFALLGPSGDFYSAGHPGPADVLLVVEVSGSSRPADLEVKTRLYAENGIAEYWIVELHARVVRVHVDPGSQGFAECRAYHRGETLSPRAFPQLRVAVDDILPPPLRP